MTAKSEKAAPLWVDLKKYPAPREMPEMTLEEGGIFKVDFGTILVTPAHIMHAVLAQHAKAPGRRPVLAIGEAATETRSGMLEVGHDPATIAVTSALAFVTRGSVARILGNVFMSLQSNPYPTRIFNDEKQARAWLHQLQVDEDR